MSADPTPGEASRILGEHTTVREWFTRDLRGFHHPCASEEEARDELAENPNVEAVVARDVTFGPMVEVK